MQTKDRQDELVRLGSRLRDVRGRRGLSQKAAASLADGAISPAGISRLEAGSNLHLGSLLALCEAYEMDVLVDRSGRIEIRGTRLGMEGS